MNIGKEERKQKGNVIEKYFDKEHSNTYDPICDACPAKKRVQRDFSVFHHIPIGWIRSNIGCENHDITSTLIMESIETIQIGTQKQNIHRYEPFHDKEVQFVILYVRGGSFVGGDSEGTRNLCRYMAQCMQARVYDVDYRLAPEHPFPAGLLDVETAIAYVFDHDPLLKQNQKGLVVAGDSAGGNLATVACLNDRLQFGNRIQQLVLFYPFCDYTKECFDAFDYDAFEIEEQQAFFVKKELIKLKESLQFVKPMYLKQEEDTNPSVSILLSKQLAKLPPTLLVSAQYDFLFPQAVSLKERLMAEGVDVTHIIYKGMFHAFLDRIGDYPQAQDAVEEMKHWLQEKKHIDSDIDI